MNIFALSYDPVKAAQWQCDAHVVKMPTETLQMLSTVHWQLGTNSNLIPYKKTHEHHPCVKWIKESTANYSWLCSMGISLCEEYTKRYNKQHATEQGVRRMAQLVPKQLLNRDSVNRFALAITEPYTKQCTVEDTVQTYRNFYLLAKRNGRLGKWKQNKPEWWIDDPAQALEFVVSQH